MSYKVKVLCDSIALGTRLTTFVVTMPRFLLAEFNTHRVLSRNSASSRAIPVEKRIAMLESDPFVPEAFQQNIRGMQGGAPLDPMAQDNAKQIWMQAAKSAIQHAKSLANLGVHKQWANRLLEPFAWHTVVCTATEWENFFNLRTHPDAQPEIQVVARMMKAAMEESKPQPLELGEWHIPFITEEDINESCGNPSCMPDDLWLVKLSVARCARVSYLTHDTGKRDVVADLALHDRLLTSGHMSPFEHCAQRVGAMFDCDSNFSYPWKQYRKFIPGEKVYRGDK